MKQTVVGLFNKPDDAQQAVQHLTSNGFTMDNVDMSLSYANTLISTRTTGMMMSTKAALPGFSKTSLAMMTMMPADTAKPAVANQSLPFTHYQKMKHTKPLTYSTIAVR